MLADGILQRRPAIGKFLANFFCAFEDQQRMREGVVAHDVAGLNDLANDFRTLPHVATDQKKSCVYAVPRKNLQQSQVCGSLGPSSYVRAICLLPRPTPVNVRPYHCPVGAID